MRDGCAHDRRGAEPHGGDLRGDDRGPKPGLQSAKGFISHAGGPSPDGGWRVVEVWESEDDGTAWFEANVRPNLPPDIVPNRQFFPLHTAFTAGDPTQSRGRRHAIGTARST